MSGRTPSFAASAIRPGDLAISSVVGDIGQKRRRERGRGRARRGRLYDRKVEHEAPFSQWRTSRRRPFIDALQDCYLPCYQVVLADLECIRLHLQTTDVDANCQFLGFRQPLSSLF